METINYISIDNNTNGNPRFVVHFLDFLNDKDVEQIKKDFAASLNQNPFLLTGLKYDLAIYKSKQIGGKKYNTKNYGGGIAFTSYNIEETIKQIQSIANQNF